MSGAGGLPPRYATPRLAAAGSGGSNGGVPFLQLGPGLRVSSSGGAPMRPGLRASSSGGRPLMLGGLGLALSRSASGGSAAAKSSELTRESHLPEGHAVDEEGINGRTVYIIREAATGEPVGVRKFAYAAEAGRAYDAAREESRIYKEIQAAQPDWADHILPFRKSFSSRDTIIMDFDWIPGSDMFHWIDAGATRQDILNALDHSARQLRWLAIAGWTHGDIKADNFYITADGRVLLFDFDKARRRTMNGALKDRQNFITMIEPYASAKTIARLRDLGPVHPLTEFYVLAGRLLRREGRPPRFRTRGRRRSSTRRKSRST